MKDNFKNKLIITTDQGSILDDEFQEECDFVKNLLGLKRFAVRSDFKSTWYNRGKNREYKRFGKYRSYGRNSCDNENFKFKDRPMFYLKHTEIDLPYHIPAHFSDMDNDYVEDYKFKGETHYSEGPYYLRHSHIDAFIDGELDDEIGYDILNYVHGHVPMMKRLGDYVKGYVFHVDEYDSELSVPHKIFNIVKGRRLIMFPILFYLNEIGTSWDSDGMKDDVERAKKKGEEFKGYVRVDHTCYAKADNQVSRDEIEYYKKKGKPNENDKYPFIIDFTNIRFKDLYTRKIHNPDDLEDWTATIGIVEEKSYGHLGNFMPEKEKRIKSELKKNGGKTDYEVRNDPVWCEELKEYVPRKCYNKMKELNEFDSYKHVNWREKY